jgi:hypothetical protein
VDPVEWFLLPLSCFVVLLLRGFKEAKKRC